MSLSIALVGKPNCGKTAVFNALTGGRAKVANYPGVTVEKKEGVLPCASGFQHIIDLPGTYSLRARTPDEAVTRDVVLGRMVGEPCPDVLLCVADATNLKICLRLLLELKTTGLPLILAVNMRDIAERQGVKLDLAKLSELLGIPVFATAATQKQGLAELQQFLFAWRCESADSAEHPTERGEARSGGIGGLPPTEKWIEPDSAQLRRWVKEAAEIASAITLSKGTPLTLTRKIDRVLLHPFWGMLALTAVVFFVFQCLFNFAEMPMNAIDGAVVALQELATTHLPDNALRSLLVDGILAGVGSVVIFLPQILILFFFIILLEDSGYMARAAFMLDKLMGGVGLHGRAFIPMLSSFACAIPGIMATRTIDNRHDRLVTILIAPLMTCSARLPVYTLIIAAFIPNTALLGGWVHLRGLVMFGLYLAGIVSALLVAWIIKTLMLKQVREPFLMELPSYKLPAWRNVTLWLWERAAVFLKRAGTIIFALMVLVWALSSYPVAPHDATEPAILYSFAGMLGKWLEPLFAPIGFHWQIVIALIPGMAAREVAVAALATVYALSGDATDSLQQALAADWTLPTALSFLVWYVFAPQCVATLGVIKRETNGYRWPLVAFAYLTALAYLASFVTYRVAVAW